MNEIRINIPEGYEVDIERSNLKEGIIFFKQVISEFDQLVKKELNGYIISPVDNEVVPNKTRLSWKGGVFPTEAQAKSALALANILQLMRLPQYNGDWEPDWRNLTEIKHVIEKKLNNIVIPSYLSTECALAFRTKVGRDKFFENHKNLIKQYFMIK